MLLALGRSQVEPGTLVVRSGEALLRARPERVERGNGLGLTPVERRRGELRSFKNEIALRGRELRSFGESAQMILPERRLDFGLERIEQRYAVHSVESGKFFERRCGSVL